MLKKHKHLFYIILALIIAYPVFLVALPGCGGGGGGGGFSVTGTEPTYAPLPEEPAPNEPEPAPAPATSTKYAYVSGSDGGVIDVYNADTFEFVKKMEGLSMPQGMCFSKAAKRTDDKPKYLYVANYTNVKRFNLETQSIDNSWSAVNGLGITDLKITPDDKYLYSVDAGNSKIFVTDTTTQLDIKQINPGDDAVLGSNAITSDGAYVIAPRLGSFGPPCGIPIIETVGNTVWKTAVTTLGRPINGIAIDPADAYAYVIIPQTNKVAVVQIQTGQVVGSVKVGTYPVGIAVTHDGAYAYVTNAWSNNVSVLQLNGANPVELPDKIAVGNGPAYLGISSDGKYVWVPCGNEGKVYVIRTSDNTVYKILDADSGPYAALVE